METFEQIWESSRSNSLSWMFSAAIWCGVGVLVAFSFVKNPWFRRIGKLGAIGGFCLLATEFAACAIQEKWRLRREWADLYPERMTKDGFSALTVDGANLTLGPLLLGFQAFLVLLVVAGVISVVRALVVSRRDDAPSFSDGRSADVTVDPTDNPYQPPPVTP